MLVQSSRSNIYQTRSVSRTYESPWQCLAILQFEVTQIVSLVVSHGSLDIKRSEELAKDTYMIVTLFYLCLVMEKPCSSWVTR